MKEGGMESEIDKWREVMGWLEKAGLK